MSAEEKVRKKRTPKTPQQLLNEAIEIRKKGLLLQAKESLLKVPEYVEVKDSVKEISGFLTESRELVDEAKFSEKEKNLLDRLDKLRRKREVAKNYLNKFSEAYEAFEKVQEKIGEMVTNSLVNPLDMNVKVPSENELKEVFVNGLDKEHLVVLMDGKDPFAEFRREKKEEEAKTVAEELSL